MQPQSGLAAQTAPQAAMQAPAQQPNESL
jgi:hypothetical protein